MQSICKKLWYAVSGMGQGAIFLTKPIRYERMKVWKGDMISCYSMVVMHIESEGFHLPVLKWEDEPVELELTLNLKENV